MDTNKYAALLSIIRLGSLSAAAEKMGYSPSGMTRMMDSLENEMGFPLLHRTSQGVQLTEEGKRLLPSIRELLLAEKKTRAVRCDILSLTAGELSSDPIPALLLSGCRRCFTATAIFIPM